MSKRRATTIENRKEEHVLIVSQEQVEVPHNHWDDLQLVHQALPEVDFDAVDLRTTFLGRKLQAPLLITGMTGGFRGAKRINANLAKAAAKVGVAMGVGSQRAALVDRSLADTFSVVGDHDVPLLLGNIGAPQLIPQQGGTPPLTVESCKELVDLIGGHGLAIHLNFLQEVVQPEGDLRAAGVQAAIGRIAKRIPVMAKETGAGISFEAAVALRAAGVKAIDVGGASGTSFSAVEYYRAKDHRDELRQRLGRAFWSWGIPTAAAVNEVRPVGLPMAATGGVRNGGDAAKAIALGATVAGMGRPMLLAAMRSAQAVETELQRVIAELRTAAFLTGSKDLAALRAARMLVLPPTDAWFGRAQLPARTGAARRRR